MSSKTESTHISLEINQTCPICTEDYPLNEFQVPLSCNHSFCSSCLKQYLTVKISSNSTFLVHNPDARRSSHQISLKEFLRQKYTLNIVNSSSEKSFLILSLRQFQIKISWKFERKSLLFARHFSESQ